MNAIKQKLSIVSLGCARNLVDSEVMAGLLRQDNFDLVEEPDGADIVLVNTCGFIDAAKAESVDTILEIGRLKEAGKVKKLIVAGCLSQRYSDELAKELPEVDFFIGTGEVPRIAEILRRHEADHSRRQFVGLPSYLYDHVTPRLRTTPSYSAYLKVSEGCDHKCAFCIIPQLRGPHRSRSIDSVKKPNFWPKAVSRKSTSSPRTSAPTVVTARMARRSMAYCGTWIRSGTSRGSDCYMPTPITSTMRS